MNLIPNIGTSTLWRDTVLVSWTRRFCEMSSVFKFNNGRVQSLRTVRLFLRSVITSKFFKYLNASFSISLMLLNPRSSSFKLTKPAKRTKSILDFIKNSNMLATASNLKEIFPWLSRTPNITECAGKLMVIY